MKKKKVYILIGVLSVLFLFGLICINDSFKTDKPNNEVKISQETSNKSKQAKKEVKKKTQKSSDNKSIKKDNSDNQKQSNENKQVKNIHKETEKNNVVKEDDTIDNSNQKPVHQHDFRYIEPVTKKIIDVPYAPAWNEPIYELVVHYVCNGCGIKHDSYEAAIQHMNEKMLNGDLSHSYSDNAYNEIVGYIYHEEILEQSHIEIIEQGYYVCECGMRK